MSLKPDNQDLEYLLQKKRGRATGQQPSPEAATHQDLSFLLERPRDACAPGQDGGQALPAEGAPPSDELFFDFDINDEVVDLAEELRLSRRDEPAEEIVPEVLPPAASEGFELESGTAEPAPDGMPETSEVTGSADETPLTYELLSDSAEPPCDEDTPSESAQATESAVASGFLASENPPSSELSIPEVPGAVPAFDLSLSGEHPGDGLDPSEAEPPAEATAATDAPPVPDVTHEAENDPPAEHDFSLEEISNKDSSVAGQAECRRDAEHAAIVEALTSEMAEKETAEKVPVAGKQTVFGAFLQETQGKKGVPAREHSAKRDSGKDSRLSESRPGLDFATLFANSSFLGLDLGSSSIKHVLLRKSATGIRLLSVGAHKSAAPAWKATPPDGQSALAGVLREKPLSGQVKNALVTSAVSGMEVVFKNIEMPRMSRKDLHRAVPWACRKDFPFPVEATIFEFTSFSDAKVKDGKKTPVFVIGALRELVERHVHTLNAAGIAPAKVSTIPAALLRTFRLCASKEMLNESYAVIDIGTESSHIVFLNKGRLQFARQISTGGGEFTEALTGDIFVDGREIYLRESEAEGLKRRYGIPSENDESLIAGGIALREVAVMLGPIVERLASELQRTAEFCKEKFKVAKLSGIFLTGGGALMPNLATRLENQLSLPVRNLNPFDAIALNKHPRADELYSMGPRFAVAVGLALDTGRELNLLPESMRGAHLFQYLKRVFRYVVVMAILVMVLLSQATSRQVSQIERSLNALRSQYREAEPRRQTYIRLQQRQQALLAQRKQYEEVLDVDLDAAEHLRAISQFILPHMTLTSMRIERRELAGKKKGDAPAVKKIMVLDGVAFETNSMEGMNLARFLMRMEKSHYFAAVSLQSQSVRKDGSLQFTIECEL